MTLTIFNQIASPLEQFEVVPLISIGAPILGSFVLALTNLGLYAIITVGLVIGVHVVANNQYRLVPSRWSVSLEASYASLANMVRDQIGSRHEIYTPFIYALFAFILVANLNGNIPYAYTVATSGVAALGLSVFVFVAVTLLGLQLHGVHFFSFFLPKGTPLPLIPMLVLIEMVSYFARAASLGVRLFSNMTAGHTLLKILATFLGQLFASGIVVAIVTLIPFAVFVALIGLEIAVSFIQAYVFTVLVCSYLKDAIELH
ncbi:MAG UNVERIFIED_CONTAM: F0F1 ATP synthase subunit A [Methylobacterium ajmalii]|jgi:F-type H+-transporting ATPase subunit a